MQKKKLIIIIMCIMICFMVIGYAAFSTSLKINGTGAITSTWRVEFSAIRTTKLTGGATNKTTPSVTATTATFEVDLVQPGDEITYEIDITNYGTLNAKINGASYSFTGTEDIYVEIGGIKKGTVIKNCSGLTTCPKATMILKVGYDKDVTSQPSEVTKTIEITIDTVQSASSVSTEEEELIPELSMPVSLVLVDRILSDNQVQSDSAIDFSAISSDTNGKGLYYTSTNTEDNKTTYYFRGNVTNNYVKFAGFYWRIVRINEDGSIRLIYNGTSADATGDAASIETSNFATSSAHYNTYIGYMYGSSSASTYALTHTNTNDSAIKGVIDDWYEANLKTNYSSYLADAGFCNDRSLEDGTGIGRDNTHYGARNRLKTNKTPQFACPQTNDLFTLKGGTKGNKALDYSIGLITADEVAYAGGVYDIKNSSYYLYTGSVYWTMSPYWVDGEFVEVVLSVKAGVDYSIREDLVNNEATVRPVINLVSDIEVTNSNSNGTSTNPYVIKTN